MFFPNPIPYTIPEP